MNNLVEEPGFIQKTCLFNTTFSVFSVTEFQKVIPMTQDSKPNICSKCSYFVIISTILICIFISHYDTGAQKSEEKEKHNQ